MSIVETSSLVLETPWIFELGNECYEWNISSGNDDIYGKDTEAICDDTGKPHA